MNREPLNNHLTEEQEQELKEISDKINEELNEIYRTHTTEEIKDLKRAAGIISRMSVYKPVRVKEEDSNNSNYRDVSNTTLEEYNVMRNLLKRILLYDDDTTTYNVGDKTKLGMDTGLVIEITPEEKKIVHTIFEEEGYYG